MKNIRNQTTKRLKEILTSDKLKVPEGFKEILTSDINNLLDNYFEIKNSATVSIELADDGNFTVKIYATAKKIRPFKVLT